MLAKEGATVYFCGLSEEEGTDTCAGVLAQGGKASFTYVDVANEGALRAWIDACGGA